MTRCPVCDKLVFIVPAPRDAFGRHRKRVVDHEAPALRPDVVRDGPLCAGSRILV